MAAETPWPHLLSKLLLRTQKYVLAGKGRLAGGLKHSLCGVFRGVEMPGNASAVSSRKGLLALSWESSSNLEVASPELREPRTKGVVRGLRPGGRMLSPR